MSNDVYIHDDNTEDNDNSNEWQLEFFRWEVCNNMADLIVSHGYNQIMSEVFQLVEDKYEALRQQI